MATSIEDPSEIWIYHERQEALLCGKHALNNLVQAPVFTSDQLTEIAHQLDQLEFAYFAQNNEGGTLSADYQQRLREGSGNVDAQGNFSIQVLNVALQQRYGIQLSHSLSHGIVEDITDCQGFICHRSQHWYAIRKIAGRFWNLNSMSERPTPISHFALAKELEQSQAQGYTVFPVPHGLPQPGVLHGKAGVSWHRMSDLLNGISTLPDPFDSLQGQGMRLDGGTTRAEELSEEEQLQLALQASLQETPMVTAIDIPVPPEPPASDPNTCRIQFRFPDNTRIVRLFYKTDAVTMIFAFVQQQAHGRPVELKYGFPPKLLSRSDQSIADAGLAGESVQAKIL